MCVTEMRVCAGGGHMYVCVVVSVCSAFQRSKFNFGIIFLYT